MSRTILPDFSAVKGCTLIAALSGGADSTALISMLAQVRSGLNLTLYAVHVNHGIRGEEADRDESFCRDLCNKLDVPLIVRHLDVPTLAAQSNEGVETAARRLRYDCLHQAKKDCNAQWIVLAHHQDDQAETVLMHLLRGCGPEGISGMKTFSEDLYRPLLDVPKSSLEDWLRAQDQSWCEDSTNQQSCTPRNLLRLQVLPLIRQCYPNASSAISRYAESAQWENRLMERMTDAFLQDHLQRGAYGTRLIHPETADEAILRRCLRRLAGSSLPHARLTELSAMCKKTRGRMTLPDGLEAERSPTAVYFFRKNISPLEPVPLLMNGTTALSNIGQMRVQPNEPKPIYGDPYRQVLNRNALQGAVLRTRRDGDQIRPLGCGNKLLSDVFIDHKIDRPLRDTIPLVAKGSRILWAVGICISEEARIYPNEPQAVELQWLDHRINSDSITSEH